MALWATRGTGVLFGGVTDEDTNEETLESVFHNDLSVCSLLLYFVVADGKRHRYGYQIAGNGRWLSLVLRKPKKNKATGKKAKQAPVRPGRGSDEDENEGEYGISDGEADNGSSVRLSIPITELVS